MFAGCLRRLGHEQKGQDQVLGQTTGQQTAKQETSSAPCAEPWELRRCRIWRSAGGMGGDGTRLGRCAGPSWRERWRLNRISLILSALGSRSSGYHVHPSPDSHYRRICFPYMSPLIRELAP
jgi:hypothetical protein